jgi:hypothetical protein
MPASMRTSTKKNIIIIFVFQCLQHPWIVNASLDADEQLPSLVLSLVTLEIYHCAL